MFKQITQTNTIKSERLNTKEKRDKYKYKLDTDLIKYHLELNQIKYPYLDKIDGGILKHMQY